jgi:TatD DNase family protein
MQPEMNQSIFHEHNLLDFHTHSRRHADSDDVAEIISVHLGQEKDKKYYTVGLHPWWTESVITDKQKSALIALLSDSNCLAMGEMGIDRLKGPDLTIQMEVLRSQLAIAQELEKPVIIHCVRAFDHLMQIKKEFPEISKWCVHGYGRHSILAQQLIDHGFYLSLMPAPAAKYQEWFTTLPLDKLFLETDSTPQITIAQIYSLVAEVSGITMDELCKQMNNNASNFFER